MTRYAPLPPVTEFRIVTFEPELFHSVMRAPLTRPAPIERRLPPPVVIQPLHTTVLGAGKSVFAALIVTAALRLTEFWAGVRRLFASRPAYPLAAPFAETA